MVISSTNPHNKKKYVIINEIELYISLNFKTFLQIKGKILHPKLYSQHTLGQEDLLYFPKTVALIALLCKVSASLLSLTFRGSRYTAQLLAIRIRKVY